jgi:hypothetical protein
MQQRMYSEKAWYGERSLNCSTSVTCNRKATAKTRDSHTRRQ